MEPDNNDVSRSALWKRRRADIQNSIFTRVAAELTARRLAEWEADPATVAQREAFLADQQNQREPEFTSHNYANASRMREALLALHELLGDRREAAFTVDQIGTTMARLSARRKCDRKTAWRALRDLADGAFISKTETDRARWKGGDGPNKYFIVFSTLRDMAAEQGMQGRLFADVEDDAPAAAGGRPDRRSGERSPATSTPRPTHEGIESTSAARGGQPGTRPGESPRVELDHRARREGSSNTLAAGSGRPGKRPGAWDAAHGDLALGHGDLALGHGDLALGHSDLALGHGDLALGHGDLAPRVTREALPGAPPLKSLNQRNQNTSSSSLNRLDLTGGGGGRVKWSGEDEARLIGRMRGLRANDPADIVRFPAIVLRYARQNGWTAQQIDELIDRFLAERIGDVFAHDLTALCATLKHHPPGTRIPFAPCDRFSRMRHERDRSNDFRLQAAERDREAEARKAAFDARQQLEDRFGPALDAIDGVQLAELLEQVCSTRFDLQQARKYQKPTDKIRRFGPIMRPRMLQALADREKVCHANPS